MNKNEANGLKLGRNCSADELRFMTRAVGQVYAGNFSYREAAAAYGITKYQIEKWISILGIKKEGVSTGIAGDELKVQVLKAVNNDGMTQREATEKFGVSKLLVGIWIQLYHDPKSGSKFSKERLYEDTVPARLTKEYQESKAVEQIQTGDLSISDTVRMYGVTRHRVRTWISTHTGINIAAIITHPVYCAMTLEEKNSELEEKLLQLEKQLIDAHLKISGLEVLIEVAEDKFEIQIKKSLARSRQKNEDKTCGRKPHIHLQGIWCNKAGFLFCRICY